MKYRALVKEVMNTNVKLVDVTDSVQAAAKIMAQYRIGSVIVTGEKNIKGILTAEDIVYKHVAQGVGSKVADIMTRDPITISPDKSIEDAARVMSQRKIKKLPVIENGRITGIITATDIIKIEPAMYETLLEHLKILRPGSPPAPVGAQMFQCEVCSNYSDDVSEMDGVWICSECEEMREKH